MNWPGVWGVTDIIEFLAGRLADSTTQWSLGTFGAIAEFSRDVDERAALALEGPALAVVTAVVFVRGPRCNSRVRTSRA